MRFDAPVLDDVVTTLLTMTKPSSTMSVSSIDERPPDDGGRLPKLPRRPTVRPAIAGPALPPVAKFQRLSHAVLDTLDIMLATECSSLS